MTVHLIAVKMTSLILSSKQKQVFRLLFSTAKIQLIAPLERTVRLPQATVLEETNN